MWERSGGAAAAAGNHTCSSSRFIALSFKPSLLASSPSTSSCCFASSRTFPALVRTR